MQLSSPFKTKYLKIKNWRTHSFSFQNNVDFILSGNNFFDELEKLIHQAKYFIHLQTYIFDADETGTKVLNMLIKKANEGVKIFIILDGFGSAGLSKNSIKQLTDAGIYFKFFSPFHSKFKFRFGRRLHHKIVLVDGKIALVGGINIAQKYKGNICENPWLDFAVKVRGVACIDILKICEDVWGRKQKKKFPHLYQTDKIFKNIGSVKTKILQNDWTRRYIEISTFYRQNIRHAKHSVTIAASYFLPGIRILKLLKKASQRGVKITLILSGKSDVGLMKLATNYLYPFLLRHRVEIFEWNPSVMHGKLMIVDEKITTIGSYNLNALSDYGSTELNVCIEDEKFAKNVQNKMTDFISTSCKKKLPDEYRKQHHWWNQMFNWTSYQILRTLLKIFFFLIRK